MNNNDIRLAQILATYDRNVRSNEEIEREILLNVRKCLEETKKVDIIDKIENEIYNFMLSSEDDGITVRNVLVYLDKNGHVISANKVMRILNKFTKDGLAVKMRSSSEKYKGEYTTYTYYSPVFSEDVEILEKEYYDKMNSLLYAVLKAFGSRTYSVKDDDMSKIEETMKFLVEHKW